LQVELIFGVQIRIISPVNAGSFLREVVALCFDAAIVQEDKAVAGIFRESTGSIRKHDKLIMFVDRTFPSIVYLSLRSFLLEMKNELLVIRKGYFLACLNKQAVNGAVRPS
jgi:hypothetical protein